MVQWDLKFHIKILSKFETEFSLLRSKMRHTSGESSYGIFHRLRLWPNAASSAFSIITSPVWATGSRLCSITPGHGFCGEGARPYALTFGMETREDTVQFRRRKSFSGTIDWSAGNHPPPRKTIWILVGGQSVRARPVRSGRLSGPGRVGVSRYRRLAGRGRDPSPAPTPRVIPTTVHYPGETEDTPRSAELVRGFNRACTSPTANPERIAPMVAFAPMG